MFAAVQVVACLLAATAACLAAGGAMAQVDCTGKPNTIPPGIAKPRLLRTVPNGKLYDANSGVSPPLLVAHLFGSPYQVGKAHGELLRTEIHTLLGQLDAWILQQVEQGVPSLPTWLDELIAKYGSEAALDATYLLTESYISEDWKQEIQGMADGSGKTYMEIARVQMLPELIKAACSMYGAWGDAVKDVNNATLMQLRALDWDTTGPFQQFPTLFVYHPEAGNGHAFTSLAWAGFNGAMTGFSSQPVGVCEKVWLGYKGESSRSGIPWNFLLRDILQYDGSIEAAMKRIHSAHRTCSIWVGLGDGKTFNTVQYSYEEVNQYNAQNFPAYPPYHPKFDDLVFVDKHVQPSHHMCLGSLMTKYYGKLEPQLTVRDITAVHQTGDMHLMVMDYATSELWISNAGIYNNVTKTAEPAYNRKATVLNAKELFAEKP